MKGKLFFILAFLFSNIVSAQLVNIESKRMQTDSTRFVFNSDLSFSYSDVDGEYYYRISNVLSTQLKSKDLRKIYFLIGNYKLVRTQGQDFQNSWFLHLRFNYKITNLVRLEAFVQSQSDKLLVIDSRNLTGFGVRFKLISKEHVKLYLGNAYMYEEEKSDAFNTNKFNHRNSSYISLTAAFPEKNISILNTLYYQPLYNDFNNYRILEQFKVDVSLSEHLSVFTVFNYDYVSETPSGSNQFRSYIEFGLGIHL